MDGSLGRKQEITDGFVRSQVSSEAKYDGQSLQEAIISADWFIPCDGGWALPHTTNEIVKLMK